MSAACATTSFDSTGLALELGLGERLLEAGIGEIVIGLIAEAALRDDQRDRLFSRRAVASPQGPRRGPKSCPTFDSRALLFSFRLGAFEPRTAALRISA